MRYERIKGTQDIFGDEIDYWYFIEENARIVANLYGYRELRTPIIEPTELFVRSVGEDTDIVQKEMYTFIDKGGRSITLRPEGTAPTVRAFIENSMLNSGLPQRFFYIGPMFRYERPQAGRLRQFHQFGVELIGSAHPSSDAEVLLLAEHFLNKIGVRDHVLHLNSIGCPKCRPVYRQKLKEYYESHVDELCEDCKRRMETNVLRLLDCKIDVALAERAPKSFEFLCEECQSHYDALRKRLYELGISFVEDGTLVRGLDYYNRTVFEIRHKELGAQNTILAGGRYDGLFAELGGQSTPALGFACGIERLILALKIHGVQVPQKKACFAYVVCIGEKSSIEGFKIAEELRKRGVPTVTDVSDRKLTAQLRHADKLGAKVALILGDEELSRSVAHVKILDKFTQIEVSLDVATDYIVELYRSNF
ncbi:histidine--tRNA ligase [Pseudothermotoga sp.]|uniref:histidine--tRNA ligase n=1 Tax=Pseudothermotoga sp. TaxID=2033661 RepID=UPI0031F6BA15